MMLVFLYNLSMSFGFRIMIPFVPGTEHVCAAEVHLSLSLSRVFKKNINLILQEGSLFFSYTFSDV